MASSCARDPFPRAACAVRVLSNRSIANGVFELVAGRESLESPSSVVPAPESGQFFMLRARPSGVLLGRPISVYRSDEKGITFLILKKGKGSAELCALDGGDSLDLVGPIGNRFLPPEKNGLRVALVGGGIGVAPVAGFALGLPPKTFDFYASFRSGAYGLDGLDERASRVFITTEDGSAGTKGMLTAVFDASRYDLVYACGPTPMLRYVREACLSSGTRAFLSLEEHMACGAGACLGCTVRTTAGNRRCCVDGPVFEASEILL